MLKNLFSLHNNKTNSGKNKKYILKDIKDNIKINLCKFELNKTLQVNLLAIVKTKVKIYM